jgi:hypothetical protein
VTTDLPKLERDARLATDALNAAKAEQAEAAKAAGAERQARSIEWAFDTIARYPQRQAEASAEVSPALTAFSAAVFDDYGQAPARYLAIATTMSASNAVAAEFTRARHLLRAAGALPHAGSNRPDPTGAAAPFPTFGGNIALPPFHDLVASTIEAARMLAARLPAAGADPGSFEGQASEAMRRDVLASEFVVTQEFEHLLGMRERYPDKYDRLVPIERRADAEAYAATREASGFDAPLPKVIVETTPGSETSDFAPDDLVRIRPYR